MIVHYIIVCLITKHKRDCNGMLQREIFDSIDGMNCK
jgi:hypothetical protein